MGEGSRRRRSRVADSDSSSETESQSSSLSESDEFRRSSRKRRHRHRKELSSSRREKDKKRERSTKEKEKRRKTKKRRERDEDRSRGKSRKDEKRKSKKRSRRSEDDFSSDFSDSESEGDRGVPESVLRNMLTEFPNVANDLKQLLQMIDAGQAVDIKGITERSLVKHLKKLFFALNLKEKGGVFLLPSDSRPVLELVGPIINARLEKEQILKPSEPVNDFQPEAVNADSRPAIDHDSPATQAHGPDASAPRRIIGPAMPSAELLAAAAKLTEAQADLREVELDEDNEFFIGPPPPAVVAEAESANEAERFEEVTRIMGADAHDPYDVVGANHNMSTDNIKKRYWKLSLLVHPDKCSHPEAHQAFVKLNKAFKELQDPDKRKAFDEKIKLKEEQEAFKAELRSMREAAQWRKLQGISMEGDEELLADIEVNVAPKREEWMTTLPPERKPGMTMHSTTAFSRNSREGRGDTSSWTDTPSDRAQKAKTKYLEAYNAATAIASNEDDNKRMTADAELVDMYNKARRSKTLVEKHQEETKSRAKKKSKQQQPVETGEKEDWVGNHPWKPWDREKDLVSGRQKVNFDSESMAQGLSSRFSAGHFQRNFL
ncbi:hypothetical protein SAY87_001963 [Trapa incisa]|uniref:J domain-containing protein n=1 Tax=Trapa incisa TaxID=236973 RepID=A0AAN7PU46_9MYRT|nr:hypothetical protein SAY87_001963 [Trapa incisa]